MTRGRCLGFLLVVVAGCSPSSFARPGPTATPTLTIPPIDRSATRSEPALVRFDEGGAAPTGCFAVSRRTGAVACVVGQYAAASDEGDRRVTLLGSDQGEADLPLHVESAGGGLPEPLARPSRIALDELMRGGDFVALAPPAMLEVESSGDYGNLRVELHARPYDPAGIARANLQVLVRSRAVTAPENDRTHDVLLENVLSDVTCAAPRLAIRTLERSRLLIERLCELGDGGIISSAWLCDDEGDRCE